MAFESLKLVDVFNQAARKATIVFPWEQGFVGARYGAPVPTLWALPLAVGEFGITEDPESEFRILLIGTRFGTVALAEFNNNTGIGIRRNVDTTNPVLFALMPVSKPSGIALAQIVGPNGNTKDSIAWRIERMHGAFCDEA